MEMGKAVMAVVVGVLVLAAHCEAGKLAASFVFGDSLVDAGNNNYLTTLSKANIRPNGCDFKPSKGAPTGRYTNGRIIPDIIADELGIGGYAPPFLAPSAKGSAILHGVNYGSGGSGILNSTGAIFVGRLSLEVQIDNFVETRKELISMLGEKGAKDFINKSVFSITMGANDFINNYLVPFASTVQRVFVGEDSFIDQVISTYHVQLKRLYDLDARRLVVANVGPIGCIPYQRTINRVDEDQCAALPNELALKFNKRLKDIMKDLNANCTGATFLLANTYDMVEDVIKNYAKYGFEASNLACCGRGGQFKGIIPCGPTSIECTDHTKYVFWDPYHPSEAANVIVAKKLIDGGPNDIYPMNLRKLISL
ncbi:GDSL esterase/lipase At2g23540 [Cryptomeria japonica]|uniref:GDSL esterase/lipase At2g23540 n=1 Tax=Cryptomeria japonica TaxID=3369 RepID=UPI0027DA0547|nr:GDSL esterase/lipase At2g23540 [Cryptomeria japonica]